MNSKQLQEYRDKMAEEKYPDQMVQSLIAYDDDFLRPRTEESLAFNAGFDAAATLLQAEIETLKRSLYETEESSANTYGKLQAEQARSLKLLEALNKAKVRLEFISQHGLNFKAAGINPGRFESDITIKLCNEAIKEYEEGKK